MIDLAAIRFRAATKNLRKDIATDMYSTELGATKKIVGLRGITAQTGTLGNIDKATNAFWQGYNKAVGAALTWAHLNDAYVKTKKYGAGETPTIIVGSEGALQKYEDNYTKVDTGTHGVRYLVTPGKVLAGGFRAFSFKGTPFVSDPFCPSSTVFVLNENFLHARKLLEFVDTGWKSLEINGKDWVQNTIKGYFAFTCNMCKKQGYLSNVTEA